MMKKITNVAVLIAASTLCVNAAVSYTGDAILQNFTGYDGSAGPTGWDASGFSGGPGFSENRGASTGGVTTGGTYAFDIGSGNVALGVQPIGSDFTPGYYELEVVNNSGTAVDTWAVAFNSYFYNDQGRANSLGFSYSTDGTNYTPVGAGSFTSTEAAADTPVWLLGVGYSDNIAAPVSNGGSLYLRWTGDDVSGAGSRDEFALDDVGVSAVPEPSSVSLLGFAGLAALFRRKR